MLCKVEVVNNILLLRLKYVICSFFPVFRHMKVGWNIAVMFLSH